MNIVHTAHTTFTQCATRTYKNEPSLDHRRMGIQTHSAHQARSSHGLHCGCAPHGRLTLLSPHSTCLTAPSVAPRDPRPHSMHTRIPRYRHDTSESTAARLVQSLTSSDYARCQPRASRRAARHTIAITRPALVHIARPCVGTSQRAAGRPTAAAATSHPHTVQRVLKCHASRLVPW
jgi:hypothetical protein